VRDTIDDGHRLSSMVMVASSEPFASHKAVGEGGRAVHTAGQCLHGSGRAFASMA